VGNADGKRLATDTLLYRAGGMAAIVPARPHAAPTAPDEGRRVLAPWSAMSKAIRQFIAPEMVALWLLEFVLSFAIIYALFLAGANREQLFSVAVADRAAALALTIGLTAVALGLYCPNVFLQTRRLIVSTVLAGILAFPALLIVERILSLDLDLLVGPDRFWPLKILFAWIVSLLTTRLIFAVAMELRLFVTRVLVVGATADETEMNAAVAERRHGFVEVVGARAGSFGALVVDDLRAARIRTVVMSRSSAPDVSSDAVARLREAGIDVVDEAEFLERQRRRVDLEAIPADWLKSARGMLVTPTEAGLRRVADVLLSLGLLLFALPLMVVAAVLVKLDSAGPMFYRQERVGLHGSVFTLFKFRSMTVDAEADRGPAWAVQRDPRVTRVGRFIRRTRIDELPQLINVLRGEMSFIGPRPERPHFVSALAATIPNYDDRSIIKPGLTGWAQVNFRYGASIEDARTKLSYDLYYLRHRSFMLDLLILFGTVRVILFQEGAR
jgi:exopolysaccharide biosynthesis polyprenyl glycosylphosphotransferase